MTHQNTPTPDPQLDAALDEVLKEYTAPKNVHDGKTGIYYDFSFKEAKARLTAIVENEVTARLQKPYKKGWAKLYTQAEVDAIVEAREAVAIELNLNRIKQYTDASHQTMSPFQRLKEADRVIEVLLAQLPQKAKDL